MNEKEFNSKILPLKNKIFRFLLRMIGERMEAEDATQDVFAKLWLKRDYLDDKEHLEAYVLRIAKNHYLDAARSAQAKKKAKTINMEYEDMERFPEDRTNKDSESYMLIMKIVAEFEDEHKMMFQLREVEGMSIEEICELVGKKSNAVRTALSRMRKKIREELIKRYDYEPVGN